MSYDNGKGFFQELQSLSQSSKRRVLVIGTVIIMIIVVGVWVAYFNNIIAQSSQQSVADATSTNAVAAATAPTPAAAAPAPVASANSGTSGGSNVWQGMVNGLASIASIFKQPSNYMIQPQGN